MKKEVIRDTLAEKRAKELQFNFLKGREYERVYSKGRVSRAYVKDAYKKILANFPEYQKPDDGNGDEYNMGYNTAIDDISKVILTAFGKPLK